MRTGSEEEEGGDRDCKAHTVRERERRDRPRRRRVQKRKGGKGKGRKTLTPPFARGPKGKGTKSVRYSPNFPLSKLRPIFLKLFRAPFGHCCRRNWDLLTAGKVWGAIPLPRKEDR